MGRVCVTIFPSNRGSKIEEISTPASNEIQQVTNWMLKKSIPRKVNVPNPLRNLIPPPPRLDRQHLDTISKQCRLVPSKGSATNRGWGGEGIHPRSLLTRTSLDSSDTKKPPSYPPSPAVNLVEIGL